MWVDFVIKKILGIQGTELKDYFEDLELEKVIPKLLQYVYEQAESENVVWIAKEEWVELHMKESSTANESEEADQSINKNYLIQALKPISENDVRSLLTKFSPQSQLPQYSFVNEKSHLVVPIRSFKTNQPIAFLLLMGVKHKRPEKIMSKVSRDLSYMERHLTFSMQHWEAQKLSFMDDLTNLYNQKYLSHVLQNEIYRSQREEKKFSVLFMDVDYFKTVNDTRGHWVGSRLLVDIGTVLKENIRKSDYAFRYGGDEFVVVLPNTPAEHAMQVAERLRSLIEKTEFLVDGVQLHLTLSIGLATFPDHAKTYKDIIKMADEAMYCGKNKSRNVVFVAS